MTIKMKRVPLNKQGYIYSDEELRQIQLVELEMLIEFDRICRKHQIKYTIDGGTILGAVRHGGFIPWDDDADIAMLRDEYEKFCRVVDKELDSERFYFQNYNNTPGYRWGYAKLRRKGTKFVRLHQEDMPYEQGIFIDIFYYDSTPDFYPLRCIHNFQCFLFRKAFYSVIGKKTATGIAKLSYTLLSKLPEKWLYSQYDRFVISSNRNKKSKFVRSLSFPIPGSRVFGLERDWYLRPGEIQFEGDKFLAFEKPELYLTFLFGDYMTPPPEEKRKKHPVSELKLLDSN